jgi:site-specific DNA recombinase
MDTTCKTAREYLRVSQDRTGHLQSPQEQHSDNEGAAAERGWALGDPYAEADGVSASRYSAKARDAFGQLSADLAAGRFGAQVLILWESSRGSRRVGEWVSLIEACEDAGVMIHVTSHDRTYDPASPRDRKALLEDAVDSEYESGKSSKRIRRSMAANAAAGKPHGTVPFGYRREYAVNERGKRVITGQVPEPAEAAVVEELLRRLRAGHSLRAIAADFTARGITTRSGKPFTAEHLRDVALRPCYGGLRAHEVRGQGAKGNDWRKSLDGTTPAMWPPLVDAETFHAVRAMLNAPERRTSRPGRAKHLLSLIAVCDPCGGPLTATYRRGYREYGCRSKSCVRIDAGELDDYAEKIMKAYLARDDVIEQLRARGGEDDGKLAAVRGELAVERGELGDWRAKARAGKVSAASFADIEPAVLARITTLETREQELSVPAALSVIAPGKDVAARWKAAPVAARRQAARFLCSPAILGTLRLGRSPSPGHRAEPEQRVRWDRESPGT